MRGGRQGDLYSDSYGQYYADPGPYQGGNMVSYPSMPPTQQPGVEEGEIF